MRKSLILVTAMIATVVLSGCTRPGQAREVLSAQGYENIEVTGWDMFGCGEDDTFQTGFQADGPNGQRVDGVVCSGIFKGATVRVNRVID